MKKIINILILLSLLCGSIFAQAPFSKKYFHKQKKQIEKELGKPIETKITHIDGRDITTYTYKKSSSILYIVGYKDNIAISVTTNYYSDFENCMAYLRSSYRYFKKKNYKIKTLNDQFHLINSIDEKTFVIIRVHYDNEIGSYFFQEIIAGS